MVYDIKLIVFYFFGFLVRLVFRRGGGYLFSSCCLFVCSLFIFSLLFWHTCTRMLALIAVMCYALSPWWFRDSVVNGNGYRGNSLFQYNRECNGTPVNVSAMARTTVRLRPNKEPLSPFGITIIRYRYCKVAANTFGRGRFYVDCSSTRYECECNCNGSWQCPREWTDYMWQGLEESE